jgi:hypothetical protein
LELFQNMDVFNLNVFFNKYLKANKKWRWTNASDQVGRLTRNRPFMCRPIADVCPIYSSLHVLIASTIRSSQLAIRVKIIYLCLVEGERVWERRRVGSHARAIALACASMHFVKVSSGPYVYKVVDFYD